jgi:hypothetical protein
MKIITITFFFPKLVDEEEATNKSFRNQTEQHKRRKFYFFKEEQERMSKRILGFNFMHKTRKKQEEFF